MASVESWCATSAGEPRDCASGSADVAWAARHTADARASAGRDVGVVMGELDAPTVVDVSPMPGGSTSAMHRVTLVDRDGRERRVVVLRYALADVVAESPDVAAVEARALELVERLAVPTPVLLALDAHANQTDLPTLVMTMLEGRLVWETRWVRGGCHRLSTR